MRRASEFGFYPGNTGEANSAALQKAVLAGGDIFVDGCGIADIREPVVLGDNTTLRFENGLTLRRNPCPGPQNGYVFVNKGAFDGVENKHIVIEGLRLICNEVTCRSTSRKTEFCVPGLRGMLAFLHIRDLVIRDLEVMDLPAADFCIHVCTFENILIENVHIEGRKDAVHLGRGRRFVIRHGIFRTFDDPIALNAHDYASSNPALGWIEDGIIEDCYDLDDKDTVGFFCRILAGSWLDWTPGMMVRNSDTVVHNNRLYRVFMHADGEQYISNTPPTHTEGTVELDGITWVMVHEGDNHNCGCRNVVFRDIFLEKHRPIAFSFHFDNDNYSHSVYPHSVMPVQTDILFDNIVMTAPIPTFLHTATPVNRIRVNNSVLENTCINLADIGVEGTVYGKDDIVFSGVTFKGEGEQTLVRAHGRRSTTVRTFMSSVEGDYNPVTEGNVTIGVNDIGIREKK